MSDLQPDKFRFTLIIRDVITKVLTNAPDGWLKTKITYKPDSFYNGIRRTLNIPYKYVLEAGYLLRKEIYTYGVLSKATLLLQKLIPSTWDYETIYSGKINFSTAVDSQTAISADSATRDFTVQVDAYDKQKFIFPLTGPDIIDITLPPLTLKENVDFIMLSSPDFRSDAFFAIQVVNYQQNATRASVKDAGFLAQSGPIFSEVDQWCFRPTIATQVRIFGKMSFIVTVPPVSAPIQYQINFYNAAGAIVKTIFDEVIAGPVGRDIEFDFVINVPAGDFISLYFKNVTNDNTNTGFRMVSGTVSMEYNTASPASKCQGIRAYDLFQRLLQAMNIVASTGANPVVPNQSYLLNKALGGKFGNLIYTCSDSIRAGNLTSSYVGTIYQPGDTLQAGGKYLVLGSFVVYNGIHYDKDTYFDYKLGQSSFTSPDNNGFVKQTLSTPSIVMSFRDDFFQDMLALQGGQVAFGIENSKAYLEDLSYCFRPGGGLNVGVVDTSTEITPAVDLMYNSFKGGYKNQQYDKINGLSEVNSEVRYVTDLVDPAKELNIQASSRADPFGIEIARVVGVDTASSRSDNDNFMIVIKDTAEVDGSFKPSQMDALASFSGVDISYYNWYITPKQNLLRGSRYLRSIFDKMDGYTIRVSAPLKNVGLITVDSAGKRVSESANETISAAFGPRIFIPWYADIKAGLLLDASDIIDISMFSDITFTWNDVVMKGFVSGGGEINIDEGVNSAQKFKLLLTPENKTVDLIR